MTQEDFKARVSMAYEGREQWEAFLNRVWSIHISELPHWISVEDELPKETNMYVVVNHNVVCTMWWYDNLEEWAEIYVDENEHLQSRQMDGVTHWMPTPAPPKEETKWTEHTLQRDKDGFLVGEVSDLDVHLPFEVHDNEIDTWALIEDGSALVDWSGDIDTKPRYDRIRTMEQVLSNSENTGKDLKGGEQ